MPLDAWRTIDGIGPVTLEGIAAARPGLRPRTEAEWDAAVRRNVRIVARDDPQYPALLAVLPDAPIVLYVRGALEDGRVRLAIVGSRRATSYGRSVARGLASDRSQLGIEIVSGGARGIDTWAHRGALEGGGRTVAVFGCGLGRAYPPENADLFDTIAGSGALLSEFPLEMSPLPENFPRRNRLISALCAATIVVEATESSGSLITAGHALEQGREVMAVPGPVDSEQSRGCHRLIQQGAKLVQSVDDVLEELSPMYANALTSPASARREAEPVGKPAFPELPPDEVAVLALFDDPRPVHVDVLAAAAPFGMARLQPALFGLALRGRIEQMPGGYYVARPVSGSQGPPDR